MNPLVAELEALADMDAVPRKLRTDASGVLPANASLLWSRIDGRATLSTILRECALGQYEALCVLVLLADRGFVTLVR